MKTVLLTVLGVFFALNGINHLINTQVYHKYAKKRGMIQPLLMVRMSAVVLIGGGITLITGYFMEWGILGLSVFLVLAAFMVHRFWEEKETESKLSEGMHFAKNVVILTELAYLFSTLSHT